MTIEEQNEALKEALDGLLSALSMYGIDNLPSRAQDAYRIANNVLDESLSE